MLYCFLCINALQAPGALLLALARAGINIAPTAADTAALQTGGVQVPVLSTSAYTSTYSTSNLIYTLI
jgi:hypothetical protein